ncbi:MAG: SpoIIE family protein phosphatase [Omnitrophica WOR_2 bacterium]
MSNRSVIKVAIACDQDIYRRGLVSLITSLKGYQLVGEAVNGTEAIQLCDLVSPDLIFLDFKKGQENSSTLAQRILQNHPGIAVVLLIDSSEEKQINGEQKASYTRLLPRDISEEEFIRVIQQIPQASALMEVEINPLLNTDTIQQITYRLRDSALDQPALASILSHYLPIIFPGAAIHIRIFPNLDLVSSLSESSNPAVESIFRWLRSTSEPRCFLPGDSLPWGTNLYSGNPLILAPIMKEWQTIGGIYVLMPDPTAETSVYLSILQSIATQVSAAIDLIQSRNQDRVGEVVTRELVMAGRIQADILPEKAPVIAGWDIAAKLESARETSGDFYDFIPLANQNWGIVIADVTDKGMGAALFMALTNTLIRTYATRYPAVPALTMNVVNQRLLSDTRGSMFVTAFYGILEPHTGRLRYSNAGHPPPYMLSLKKGKPVDQLRPTGMALGLLEDTHWQQKIAKLYPGDVLLLYTDGVTEAQNSQGEFFGEQRLLEIVRSNSNNSAHEIQQAVLDKVHDFSGGRPRQDDIAIVVICRRR